MDLLSIPPVAPVVDKAMLLFYIITFSSFHKNVWHLPILPVRKVGGGEGVGGERKEISPVFQSCATPMAP